MRMYSLTTTSSLFCGGGIKRNPLYFQYKEVGAVPTLRSKWERKEF